MRAPIHKGVATFFAVAPSLNPSTYDQTKAALAVVDKTLAEVGSSKDRILTATVFVAD
jgi:enamine deaminase RidA (YjgF/YER057c/UK114 family)